MRERHERKREGETHKTSHHMRPQGVLVSAVECVCVCIADRCQENDVS